MIETNKHKKNALQFSSINVLSTEALVRALFLHLQLGKPYCHFHMVIRATQILAVCRAKVVTD